MKSTFRQSLTWLHTWAGLLLGWVAYAVFLTGSASYFRPEITRWMQPELAGHVAAIDAARTAVRALEARASDASRWFIELPDARSHELRAFWQPAGGGRFKNAQLDTRTGEDVQARASHGGEFFYRFHFQLLLPHPWGRYTAGVVALAMFIALLTGIVAHRRFFADLFLFRPGRVALRSWLDFHNVAGTLTLPFCLMISYSALIIFSTLYLPWPGKFIPAEKSAPPAATAATSSPSASAPLEPMFALARERWGDERTVKRIEVTGRGSEKAEVVFTRGDGENVAYNSREQLRFNGVTGALLSDAPLNADHGFGRKLHGVFYGLHLARFANPLLRGLLFSLGLLGTALIASGLVMWTLKRRPKLANASVGGRFGFWLVERLNIAAIAGLPLACAALFWANRGLPLDVADRANLEVRVFLIAWGVALLHSLVRPAIHAWREQLLGGAALFLALPALDFFTAREFLFAAARTGDRAYLGFELIVVAVGVFLAVAAGKVHRRLHSAPSAAPAKPVAEKLTPSEVTP